MTFDLAVEAVKSGLLVTRGSFVSGECMGYDPVKGRFYTLSRTGQRSGYMPARSDREATDWSLLSRDAGPR